MMSDSDFEDAFIEDMIGFETTNDVSAKSPNDSQTMMTAEQVRNGSAEDNEEFAKQFNLNDNNNNN